MKKIFTILFCLNIWMVNANSYRYELAIGAIFQDEAPYLKEWIEFHKLVGVQHFYLYNNCSTDDYLSVIKSYIEAGEVELLQWPILATSWNNWIYKVQPAAYVDCVKRATGQAKWLALIDIDEFLTPVSVTVPEILKNYEDCAGVCFNWKIFGHSDIYDLPPNKLLVESLVMTAPIERATNLGVKSIVRPEYVEDCNHPHYVVYKEGFHHVNSSKVQNIDVNGATDKPYYQHLAVNHYWSRTGSYLYKKLQRYSIWVPEIVPENWPDYVNGMNEVLDHSMEPFIIPLRQKMGWNRNS